MRQLLSISIGILISTFLSFSQSDTILVSSGIKDSIDMKYDRVYRLFLQDKSHDVRHLWKVSLLQLTPTPIILAYEQKIGKRWSNETFLYSILSIYNAGNTYFNFDFINYHCDIHANDRIKYYYNLTRRERLGKNTGGFSGNYIGIGVFVQDNFYKSFPMNYNYPLVKYGSLLYYGLQRRIGNIGFFETYLGMGYCFAPHNPSFTGTYSDFGFRLGFAIESVAELKKMLR